MKRLAFYTGVALATLAVLFLLWQFRLAVFLFLLSLMVAAILRPVVDSLEARKIRRGLALTITYLGVVVFIIALALFLGGPVLAELQGILTDLPKTYTQIHTAWLKGTWLQQTIATNFPDLNNLLKTLPGGQWDVMVQNLLNVTRITLELGSDFIIIFALSIYWSADENHFKRLWLSLLPVEMRARSRDVWQNLDKEVGAYLRSELTQSFLTLVLLAAGYKLLGLPNPLLLALAGALSWLIVWFGGLAATALAFLVGLMLSPLMGAASALLTIAVLAFMEYMVQPRLFNHTWISSLLIIIMVLLLVSTFGIMGFLFAAPLAALIQVLAGQLIFTPPPATVPIEAPPMIQIDVLRERLNTIQASLHSNGEEPASPEILNLIERLDQLLDETKQEEPFAE